MDIMRFDLVDLQLFIAVADSRSITRGADRSHLALASASARIKGLEEALGVALFKRGRRGVELTAAGESLLDHARLVIHNVDAMRGDLARFACGVTANVLLLANTSGLSEHLPKALASFLRAHPEINVDVEEHESIDIAAAIASGAADLGFAAEHALPGNHRALHLQRGSPDAGDGEEGAVRRPAPDRFPGGGRPAISSGSPMRPRCRRIFPGMPRGSASACMSARGCGISTRSAGWSRPMSASPWCRKPPHAAARASCRLRRCASATAGPTASS